MTSNIAYVRVSTQEQNPARQFEALKPYSVEKTFEEKISGANANRPELKKMLEYVREGDRVYIESISRLARSTRDFLNILDTLTAKKVSLVSLKESIDTATPQGRFMLSVFAALSELERETTKQRQREGISVSLATGRTKTGRKYGRPSAVVTDAYKAAYKQWKAGTITATQAMKQAGVKKNTFYNLAKKMDK